MVVAEIEPECDLILGKGCHLRPRDPVEMGRFVVGEEVFHLELERFRAIVEEEPTDTDHVELLVAGWSAVGCGRGAVATDPFP